VCSRTGTSSPACRVVTAGVRRGSVRAELLRGIRPSATSNACSTVAHYGAYRKSPDCDRACLHSASGCKQNGVDRLFTSRYGLRHTMRRGPNLAPPEPGTGRPPFGQRMRIRFLRYRISGRDPGSPHPLGAAILSAAVARRAAGLARAGSRRSARCAAAAERSAGSR